MSMFCFIKAMQPTLPVVGVVSNGGSITKDELLNAVRADIPVIVVEGSGRLANEVAKHLHDRDCEGDDFDAQSIDDDHVREILVRGNIQLIDVTASPAVLQEMLIVEMAKQAARFLIT